MFTKTKVVSALFIFLSTLILVSYCVFAAAISPYEVRSLPSGSIVTVNGYAYSATDIAGTGFKNEFYLSDTSARGICVELSENHHISLYKEYSVTGTIHRSNGDLKLLCTDISALSGETTRKVKRLSFEEALDYDTNGGTFVKLSGEASSPVLTNNLLSSFTLTKDSDQIRIIIEKDVHSLSKGEIGKSELTENLRYKRNVTVNGFIAKIGNETVIRVKDCDDIDVQYHLCKFGEATTEKQPTCIENGLSVRSCDCGMREEVVIPALSHKFYEETQLSSTCTANGVKVKKCRNCSFREETILPLKDHSYKTKILKASFTSDGSISEICSVCGDIKNHTVISAASDVRLSENSFIYDGKVHAPTVTIKDKNDNTITDFDLDCDSCKEIGRHSLTIKLKGNYQGSKTLYYTIIPADVTDVNASVISKDATFSFKESKGADGYRIYYLKGDKEESLGTFEKSTCSVTLPDYGKAYTIIIKAYKKIDGTTLWSKGISTIISTGPDYVTGVKSESNFFSVKLTWNETETADGYRVYIRKSNGKYKILTTTEKTSFTVCGLSADTDYGFAVKAYRNADGRILWGKSTKVTASTLNGKPSTFSAKESFNSVALLWKDVKGADGYKIYVYNSKKKKYTTLKAVTSNNYTAEELKSGTTYRFALKPYAKENGKTYYGKPVYLTVTTKLTRPAVSASITAKGNILKWNKVNGADGYEIYFSTHNDGSFRKLKTTTSTSYTHNGISSSKNYYYKVRAYKTVNGEKLYSSFSTVKKAKR